jgi:hypothetical protein
MLELDYRRPGYYTWTEATVKVGNTEIKYDLDINKDLLKELKVLLTAAQDLYAYSDLSEEKFFDIVKEHLLEEIQYTGNYSDE